MHYGLAIKLSTRRWSKIHYCKSFKNNGEVCSTRPKYLSQVIDLTIVVFGTVAAAIRLQPEQRHVDLDDDSFYKWN